VISQLEQQSHEISKSSYAVKSKIKALQSDSNIVSLQEAPELLKNDVDGNWYS
jgi:hypothetical protein